MSEADAHSYGYAPSSTGLSRGDNAPAAQAQGSGGGGGDYFGEMGVGVGGGYTLDGGAQQQQQQASAPHGPGKVHAAVELGGARDSLPRRPRVGSRGSSSGHGSELAADNTSSTPPHGPSPAFGGGAGGFHGPASPVESIAGRFELYGGEIGRETPPAGGLEGGRFHDDAQEEEVDVGRPGAVGGGSGTGTGMLPQPFPTPGSERSEFATPSPMSRDEAAAMSPRRNV